MQTLQIADAPAVAEELSKLRDALRSSQQHVHNLMGSAGDLTLSQVSDVSCECVYTSLPPPRPRLPPMKLQLQAVIGTSLRLQVTGLVKHETLFAYSLSVAPLIAAHVWHMYYECGRPSCISQKHEASSPSTHPLSSRLLACQPCPHERRVQRMGSCSLSAILCCVEHVCVPMALSWSNALHMLS